MKKEVKNELIEKTEHSVEKKAKKIKTVSASKLPKILKKKYSQKKLDKLLKRIYVAQDKELVKSFFVPVENKEGIFCIPKKSLIQSSDFNRLKKIGKDVASQKMSIKLLPLTVTVGTIVAVVMLVCAFKNSVAKFLLTRGMESVFGAKTDIAFVDVGIFDSRISIKKIAQGYKEDPWKNLFELDEVTIDFNLTQLLRGKFDLQNIAVEGVNVMTPRKTSSELPRSPKSKEENSLTKFFADKAQIAQDAAKEELQKMFAQYNPESMLKNLESQLQTPTVAKEVYKIGDELVKKWQSKPDEMAKQIQTFADSTNELVNSDWSNISDPVTIKNNISKIESAINNGKKIFEETQTIVNEVKVDGQKINKAAVQIKNALDHDTKFVDTEVQKIKNFTIDDSLKLISGPINTIAYKTVGKYYPYLVKGVGYAMEVQKSSSGSKEKNVKEEKKSVEHKRLPGIDVYYKKDNVPKFLVERLSCSGVHWSGLATNISSDMDIRGQPAIAEAKMFIAGQNHKGSVIVDARTVTDNPLVALNYKGDNYPIGFAVPEFAMKSNSEISGKGTVDKTGAVTISACLNLMDMNFDTQKFEPEFAYNIYSRALSYLKEMYVELELNFNSDDIFKMKIKTDADKQFAQIIKKLIKDEIQIIIEETTKKLNELLQEQTKDADFKINEFIDIENGINAESIKLDKINSLLDSKKKELEAKIASESKKAINNAVGDKASSQIEKAFNGLGGLKGLKK